MFDSTSDERLFAKPLNVFSRPEWANSAADATTVSLGPSGPVAPEDLVSPDGRCALPASPQAAPAQPAAEAPPVADRPVGSMAGDLAGPAMPPGSAVPARLEPEAAPAAATVVGGIALGMTECQAVLRAGLPSNISIGAGDRGERRTVLTYLGGTWPGVYTFNGGRLKEIARAPEPAKPAKPVKKNIVKKKKAKTAQGASTMYVQ